MEQNYISTVVSNQRQFFLSGRTIDTRYRKRALIKLKSTIVKYESDINQAVRNDLGKSSFETYMCETGMVLSEISYMIKNIDKFSKKRIVKSPLAQFCSISYSIPSPYGVVLVMSPWNYPFMLTIGPLTDALAAGNTVVIKPSAYSPSTSKIIKKIINECFSEKYVTVIEGGRNENKYLLDQHFDYIFFTGSQMVGKEVMKSASRYLTPVTLELGGKSPCIVEKTANIRLAAKRIVFGKFLNCGQTCVAPDYVYCDKSIKDKLVKEIIREIKLQYGKNPIKNNKYGKIINQKHYDRILSLIDKDKLVYGGEASMDKMKIEPTVMANVTFEDDVMQQEIFGPILPVITFDNIRTVINKVNAMPHPLALYMFTEDNRLAQKVMYRCGFGGGCINDTIIHLATTEMGFGGFGESGMGSYHGKAGFDTFTHYKSIVDKKTWIDLPIRYQPYRKIYEKIIKMCLR